MSQPVIFVIDDDAGVTAALREDLDRRFGEDFRVIGETSATAGLAALRALADAGEPVALLVRCRSIKRVASAVGDGATAVRLVHEYLDSDEPALAART